MLTTEELLKQTEELNEAEKYQEVIDLLTDKLLEERQSAELYIEKARSYGGVNKVENQWQVCRKAISINPSYYKIYNSVGNYWHNNGMYDRAIRNYNRAILLNPCFAKAFYNRGCAWYNKNKYDNAFSDYYLAIYLNPNYSNKLNNLPKPTFKPSVELTIYLSKQEVTIFEAERITNASGHFLEKLGFELATEDAAIFGSYWKKIQFLFANYLYPNGLGVIIRIAIKALQLKHIELPEAEKTVKLLTAAKLLREEINAHNGPVVIKIGALLALKIKINKNYETFIWELNFKQREMLEKNDALIKDVEAVYHLINGEK